jgi:hypothetical protein
VPFLISEDDALKKHLSGLTVADQNDADRKVGVWFRLPEAEERRITYPFITIDLIDVREEYDRAHRGVVIPNYVPEGYEEPPEGFGRKATEFAIPVSLVYQITTHTRSAWQDRQLTGQMIGNKLPLRFGQLHVQADDTVRRLDLLEWQSLDSLDRDNKRVFRKAYTIAISAELWPDALLEVQKVASVGITVFHQLEPFIVELEEA